MECPHCGNLAETFDLVGVRLKLGLTQTQLAKKVGVSLRTVQRWENDAVFLPLDERQKVEALLR
jgi:DNA-binding XRE family transcriptional regulator